MLPRSAACRASLNVLGLRRIDFSIATSDRLADYRHPELGRALTVRLRPLGHIALHLGERCGVDERGNVEKPLTEYWCGRS
jgi:hypothetical protein